MSYTFKRLEKSEVSLFQNLIKLFGEIFAEPATYQKSFPSESYLKNFLNNQSHIVLAAEIEGLIVGGLVAYKLEKFEQERSEIFVYDLAVSQAHRRKGIATKLFSELKLISKKEGAYVVFVQADKDDNEAVSFYQSLKATEIETYNFDIEV